MKASQDRYLCLALLGATASGKTAFALEIAKELDAEIVCLDSTTPYRGFNIGSSKPSPSQQKQVPHHLIDILAPHENFSAGDFVRLADQAISNIHQRNKIPLIVGGTYFYLKSLQNGMYDLPPVGPDVVDALENSLEESERGLSVLYEELQKEDPSTAAKLHPNDRYRIVRALAIIRGTGKRPSDLTLSPLSSEAGKRIWMKYALLVPRHELTQAIALRTDSMLNQGLVEETRLLKEHTPAARALSSIGYSECVRFIDGVIDQKQLRNEIIEKTRQLAKRQITWLRSDPEIRFIDHRDASRLSLEVSNLQFVMNHKKDAS